MSDAIIKIPLDRLTQSVDNVRKTDRAADIPALAASIEAHGLLQNLMVRIAPPGKGRERHYEVVAGGRRLQALQLLVKRKRIAKGFAVPCKLLKQDDAQNVEVSLVENVVRTALHPADQFNAFARLHGEGLSAAEIAARFGVTSTVVEQRLKLAAASPRLMQVYREGGMTLEQLSAFTISDDHALQEHVWFEAPLFDRSAPALRQALTKTLVEGADRRARFVGVTEYEASGGTVIRDLFEADAAYFSDSQLLDRLVERKLQKASESIRREGWSWVELRIDLDYEELARFGRVAPKKARLSRKDEKRLEALGDRHDALVTELEEKPDEGAVAEIDRIEADMTALSQKQEHWSKKDRSRAGAIVSLDPRGALRVTRGLLRQKESRRTNGKSTQDERTNGRNGAEAFSEALITDLSAHRTAGLRETLAAQPDVALKALLYTLCLQTFFDISEHCVEISIVSVDLTNLADGIEESPAIGAMASRHQSWSERVPEIGELWSWLATLSRDAELQLLAYCVARSVNTTNRRGGDERQAQANTLAAAACLDMTKWWRPTRNSYFERVSKEQIIAAVTEATSKATAQAISHLKKPSMASRAENLVRETSWLPGPLRTAQVEKGR